MTKLSIDRLEHILGRVLGIGVVTSSVCLGAGLLMTFVGGSTVIASRERASLSAASLMSRP